MGSSYDAALLTEGILLVVGAIKLGAIAAAIYSVVYRVKSAGTRLSD